MADMNNAYEMMVANLKELELELDELKKSSKKDEKKKVDIYSKGAIIYTYS